MYYHESGAFDRSPINKPIYNNPVTQQLVEPATNDNSVDNNLLLWSLVLVGGAGIILLVRYLDKPSPTYWKTI